MDFFKLVKITYKLLATTRPPSNFCAPHKSRNVTLLRRPSVRRAVHRRGLLYYVSFVCVFHSESSQAAQHWCRHCMTCTLVAPTDTECASCGASLDRAASADVAALVRSMQVLPCLAILAFKRQQLLTVVFAGGQQQRRICACIQCK